MGIHPEPTGPDANLFPDERMATTSALFEAQAAVSAALARLAVEPADLDVATADMLIRLARSAECGIRGVDIGEQCQMTATRVSRLVDRAEATGLVLRTPDPHDRRAQQVVLTDKGRQAARAYAPLLSGALDSLVSETLTSQEQAVLIGLLGRLEARARQLLATGSREA